MKQPKFKFGDRVFNESCDFIVGGIHWNESYGQFEYSSAGDQESALGPSLHLYQEPQKKKLLAYWDEDEDGEVIMFRPPGTHTTLSRAPEYDIQYPAQEPKAMADKNL